MLYIATFHFVSEDDGRKSNGFFNMVAEAGNPETALEKFKSLVEQIRANGDTFDGKTEITLRNCVEIREMPAQGLLTQFESMRGAPAPAIFTALIGAPDGAAELFSLEDPDEEEVPIFLEFPAKSESDKEKKRT